MTLIEEVARGVRTVGGALPDEHFGEPVRALAAISGVPS